jgi:very long chain acyl-CoA dehydrogenase
MVGLTGLQAMGKADLEPLQKAMKAPLANLGTLIPFGVKLAKAKLGIYEKPSLSWAPAPLRSAAEVVENATGEFGIAAQQLVMKYGKGILEQQMLVERVADVVIDLTAATAAISRATKAYNANSPTAAHEVAVANLFAQEAKHRLSTNIKAINGAQHAGDKLKNQVADQIFESQRYFAKHPLGF